MTETNGGLKAELNTILPGQNPLANLSVVRTGLNDYVVLSARNGGVTRHKVTLDPAECTCPDWQYNLDDDERNVCAHYALAVIEGQDITTSDVGVSEIASLTRESRQLAKEATDLIQMAETSRSAHAALHEEKDPGPEDTAQSDASREPDGQAAAEAAETLQAAFDEHLEDMQVQHSAGHVWFQTGQDTPDDWPYPGSFDGPDFMTEVEKAVTAPDVVQYVHDGSADWADAPHELYSERPGEWWKNALEPVDVDQYISEVLE